MNYEKIYNQIINRAKTRILECYTEKHHIIPRCMGGSDEKENLVNLTAREHFICHRLLVQIHPDNNKLKFALWAMCNMKSKRQSRHVPSSRVYESIKIEVIKLISEKKKGVKLSEEHKRKTSETLKGRKRPQEVIDKIRKKRLESGWKHSDETRKKMTGRKLSDETRKKISEANIKRNSSPEFRKKLSDVSVHKRACIIDGVWYESIRQASNQLGIKWDMVSDRIKSKSEKFKNWNYVE
jgi:hypothetical protein